MSHRPGAVLNRNQDIGQLLDLLYNTGFRLTGDHQKAAILVGQAMKITAKCNIFSRLEALKGLCFAFFRSGAEHSSRVSSLRGEVRGGSGAVVWSHTPGGRVQRALLNLPVPERLVVVMRDMVGLSYKEIADMIGLEEPEVAELLTAGRRALRVLLCPPATVTEATGKTGAR